MRQQIRSRRPMKAPTGAFPPNKSAGQKALSGVFPPNKSAGSECPMCFTSQVHKAFLRAIFAPVDKGTERPHTMIMITKIQTNDNDNEKASYLW